MATVYNTNMSAQPADEYGPTQDMIVPGISTRARADAEVATMPSYRKILEPGALALKAADIPATNAFARGHLPMQANSVVFPGLIVAFDCAHDAVMTDSVKPVAVADLSQTEFALPADFAAADVTGTGFSPFQMSVHHTQIVPDKPGWFARATGRGYAGPDRWYAMLQDWDAVRDEPVNVSRFAFAGVAITNTPVISTITKTTYTGGNVKGFLTITHGGTTNVHTYNARPVMAGSMVYMDFPTVEEQAAIQSGTNRDLGRDSNPRVFVPWVLRTWPQLLAERPYLRAAHAEYKREYMALHLVGRTLESAPAYGRLRVVIK